MSFFFFKQKTAYELRISDWSSDVCSSDLVDGFAVVGAGLCHGTACPAGICSTVAAGLFEPFLLPDGCHPAAKVPGVGLDRGLVAAVMVRAACQGLCDVSCTCGPADRRCTAGLRADICRERCGAAQPLGCCGFVGGSG